VAVQPGRRRGKENLSYRKYSLLFMIDNFWNKIIITHTLAMYVRRQKNTCPIESIDFRYSTVLNIGNEIIIIKLTLAIM